MQDRGIELWLEVQSRAFVQSFSAARLDPMSDPLFQVVVVKLAADDHVLAVKISGPRDFIVGFNVSGR